MTYESVNYYTKNKEIMQTIFSKNGGKLKYTFLLLIDGKKYHEVEDNNFFDGYQRITKFLNDMTHFEFKHRVSICYIKRGENESS